MDIKLPRILSPNLGCPIIVSLNDPLPDGIDVVIAEPIDAARSDYGIMAKPSCQKDGQEFDLILEDRQELTVPGLPRAFDRVEQTRWQISTTLRASIFAGKARFVRFSAKPAAKLTKRQLRKVSGDPRITLYDLVLRRGAEELFTVFHALALRPAEGMLRFIHATDLHVALRNDTYDVALKIGAEDGSASFVNFNNNLRRFIQHANDLADQGNLDFVLLLGDLVDFIKHNYSDRDDYGENNWRLLCDILTGTEAKGGQAPENSGIKVPVFTSPGNHDWRFFPYPPAVNKAAYGLDKKAAKALDPFWADDPEELAKTTKQFYRKMIGEGALVSNVMLGGKYLHKVGDWLRNISDKFREPPRSGKVRGNLLDWLLPRMATWQVQVLAPLVASGLAATELCLEQLTIVIAAVSGLMNGIIGFVKFLVRWRSPDLMALEAGWGALRDYFLNLNPYFNYAFQVNRNYFLIMDTGFDCLRAQWFWDGGRKKLGRISIKDNLLGGSPDSMGFFDANEFYPYSQIAWMEGLLHLISDSEARRGDPVQIFVGMHTPPINLSKKQRDKAELELEGKKMEFPQEFPQEILLKKGKYNIRYGTINHYLSQFLQLCLDRQVTMVLAGHAHWRLECSLRWDAQGNNPLVYYGHYTDADERQEKQAHLKEWQPLIFQTPAIGPVGGDRFSKKPPHFRWIDIDESGAVREARVTNPELHLKTAVPPH